MEKTPKSAAPAIGRPRTVPRRLRVTTPSHEATAAAEDAETQWRPAGAVVQLRSRCTGPAGPGAQRAVPNRAPSLKNRSGITRDMTMVGGTGHYLNSGATLRAGLLELLKTAGGRKFEAGDKR